MEMIDILARLKQIQENNPNVDVNDAIASVAKTNGVVTEKAKSPYAVGMAQAMKSTGDKPPLEKSTIKKAHDIAKAVAKNEDVNEKAKNPYAIGMAAAMKATGDKPPLEKSTITKAHDIAKSIEKNEGELDESPMTRQHFQLFADVIKKIEDPAKRWDTAKMVAGVLSQSNPRFDHARFMVAAGAHSEATMPEGRVKDWLMDMESDAVTMTREEFIKKHGQSQAHIWDRVQKQEKEMEGKEMKKDKMNESIVIATDNPEEASMMMQLLKLAGVQPVGQDMINQPAASTEVPADEDYANTPKEKYSDIKAAVPNGTDLNREKGAYVKAAGGDNPMAIKMGESEITEEQLSNSLRAQYESFKKTYQEAKAKPDFLDVDKDGNKTEPMKKALKDKEKKDK